MIALLECYLTAEPTLPASRRSSQWKSENSAIKCLFHCASKKLVWLALIWHRLLQLLTYKIRSETRVIATDAQDVSVRVEEDQRGSSHK